MRTRISIATFLLIAAAMGVNAQTVQRGRSATMHTVADRGFLGVGFMEITPDRAKQLKVPNANGVEVKRVDRESPAAKAGVKLGDVIFELDGKPIESGESFMQAIAGEPAGAKIALSVWREGVKVPLTAVIESRPAMAFAAPPMPLAPPEPPALPMLRQGPNPTGYAPMVGIEGVEVTDQIAQYFGVKGGVLVWAVMPHSPADRAGLKAGDVVTKVNGTPVMNPREVSGTIRSSGRKSISFMVVRDKKEVTLEVELALNRPVAEKTDREEL